MSESKEIEVRFLDIDVAKIIDRLHKLGATDNGEDFLKEIIFYDQEELWVAQQKFARIRSSKKGVELTYKHQQTMTIDGTVEIELHIDSEVKGKELLEALGLKPARIQEKNRHTFELGNVIIDIDTWPKVPTYVELGGESEAEIKQAATKLGLDWSKAIFENAKIVIEKYYHLPVSKMKYFTFERIE